MSGLSGLAGININQLGRTVPGDIDAGRIPNRNTQTTFNNTLDAARRDPPPTPTVTASDRRAQFERASAQGPQDPPSPVVMANPAPAVTTPYLTPGFADAAATEAFVASYAGLPAAPLQQSSPPTRQDLENDPDGRIIYTTQEGDDLESVADRFGRTEEEIIAANPQLFEPPADPLPVIPGISDPGQRVVIYNDERAPGIVEIVNTNDNERRGDLIQQQLVLSVHGKGGDTPTPEDYLDSAEAELVALMPSDPDFVNQVAEVGDELTGNWQAMGLTHEVWGPLLDASEAGDFDAVEEIVTDQITALAETSPSVDEVRAYGDLLIHYGPEGTDFTAAVNNALNDFLVKRPEAAAEEVAEIYENEGAVAASERLRELTDPLATDPLTAALIAQQAQPTTEAMLNDIRLFSQMGSGVIFNNLSNVAGSADRSPEGQEVLDFMLDSILADGEDSLSIVIAPLVEYSAADPSSDPLLSLAIADRLVERGNADQAFFILERVEQGVTELENELGGAVDTLIEATLPFFSPLQWDTFISDPNNDFVLPDLDELSEQWLNENPEIREQVDEALAQINLQTYQLNRAREYLAEYAPGFDGIENQDALIELAHLDPSQEEDPRITFAVTLSPASTMNDLRQANLVGMDDGTLTSLDQIVLDPNWHLRMYPRTANAISEASGGGKIFPSSLGLTIYNGGLYSSGVYNQGRELTAKIEAHGFFDAIFNEDGWRNIVSGFHYGWGAAIKGTALANQLFGVRKPAPNTTWGKLLNDSLLGKSFAIYNVVGTATYAADGKWPEAGALGIATVGSVTNNFVVPALVARGVTVPGWVVPGANVLLLVGTGLLVVNDVINREKLAAQTEPFNEDYLIAAGVDPAIALWLANNSSSLWNGARNDFPGVSPAAPLGALAEHLDVPPGELLEWLNEQDPNFVAFLVQRLHLVHPDENGEFPVTREPEGVGWDWGNILDFEAPLTFDGIPAEVFLMPPDTIDTRQSLEDIVEWAENVGNPLP